MEFAPGVLRAGVAVAAANGVDDGFWRKALGLRRYSLNLAGEIFNFTMSLVGSEATLSSRASYRNCLAVLLSCSWLCCIAVTSGVIDLPMAVRIANCAALAAPRMPLVRAVPPVIIDGAGDSGTESSLSESSESSSMPRRRSLALRMALNK